MSEGMTDLQLRTAEKQLRLLRKAADRYRVVTSQTDWPSYNGDPSGNRYTKLTQIDKTNVARMTPKWIFPMPNAPQVENTPVVVEGVMYVTNANECYALDAGSGRRSGISSARARKASRAMPRAVSIAVLPRRRSRVHADRQRAHDRAQPLHRRTAVGNRDGRLAPELQRNIGAPGRRKPGGFGHRGRRRGRARLCRRLRSESGKEVWRFWTVPKPGEPGSETWKGKSSSIRPGATWMTGTYDAAARHSTGRWEIPVPISTAMSARATTSTPIPSSRSIAKTGKLKWYYQFTPHDVHDWDAQEPPVLVDTNWQGQPRKLLLQANRNGFFYVFDRTNGQLLLGKPFVKKPVHTLALRVLIAQIRVVRRRGHGQRLARVQAMNPRPLRQT